MSCAAGMRGTRRSAARSANARSFVPIISANTQARGEGYFRREWKLAVDRTHDMFGEPRLSRAGDHRRDARGGGRRARAVHEGAVHAAHRRRADFAVRGQREASAAIAGRGCFTLRTGRVCTAACRWWRSGPEVDRRAAVRQLEHGCRAGLLRRRALRGAAQPSCTNSGAAGDIAKLGVFLQGQGDQDRAGRA